MWLIKEEAEEKYPGVTFKGDQFWIDGSAYIGPNASIGQRAMIGPGIRIGPYACIGPGVRIGRGPGNLEIFKDRVICMYRARCKDRERSKKLINI